ncbi:uncharacterized protein [Montipora capricornis]|uniref:uncharacterized protein isoform X2 n=1 Tax=Montipora foliosa TaxID=591990 RepID=UPI0035F2115D
MASSSRKMEEQDIASERDEALEAVNVHIKEIFDILNGETLKLRKEAEAFDEVAKKLKHVHFSKTLKLNVGGQVFSTSLETMKKDSGSMFHAMFSERFDTKPTEDGTYFLDRDGTHFRYILNYLRTGNLIVPEDKIVRRELLAEAEFYQVQGIIEELKANPFEHSFILSTDKRQVLMEWLKGSLVSASNNYALIYRASRDGWGAANFHIRCDGKGPTVTVVKCGNNIFGGYTEESWEAASGIYKRDPNSFLFSLVNPSGLRPTKLPLIPGKEGLAIYCISGCGPIFGSNTPNSYYDLLINNNSNQSNTNQASPNNCYKCPEGQNASTFLAGNYTFTASEIEVFVFEK